MTVEIVRLLILGLYVAGLATWIGYGVMKRQVERLMSLYFCSGALTVFWGLNVGRQLKWWVVSAQSINYVSMTVYGLVAAVIFGAGLAMVVEGWKKHAK